MFYVRKGYVALGLSVAVIFASCSESEFVSSNAKTGTGEKRTQETTKAEDKADRRDEFDSEDEAEDEDEDEDLDEPEDDPSIDAQSAVLPDDEDGESRKQSETAIAVEEVIQGPTSCDATTMKVVTAPASCPKHSAVYASDDNANAAPNHLIFGCCPLPAGDIFTKDAATPRASRCEAGEVVTGIQDGRTVLCSKINAAKYQLAAPQATCYHGSGASGGNGATACGAPPATLAQIAAGGFGSDACLGFPFGALLVSDSGRDCRSKQAAQLLKLDGSPVTMFK